MKLAFNVLIGLVALGLFVYSFINPEGRSSIFGFAVNPWVYRAFWGVIAGLCFKDAYKAIQQK